MIRYSRQLLWEISESESTAFGIIEERGAASGGSDGIAVPIDLHTEQVPADPLLVVEKGNDRPVVCALLKWHGLTSLVIVSRDELEPDDAVERET